MDSNVRVGNDFMPRRVHPAEKTISLLFATVNETVNGTAMFFLPNTLRNGIH